MIDFFKKSHDKKLKGYMISVFRDEKSGHCFLQLVDKKDCSKRVLLREFYNQNDYERFLNEAAILRMSAKHSNVVHARKILQNMARFLKESGKVSLSLSFLLTAFLLTGCQLADSNGYHCEYIKGIKVSCEKIESEVLK